MNKHLKKYLIEESKEIVIKAYGIESEKERDKFIEDSVYNLFDPFKFASLKKPRRKNDWRWKTKNNKNSKRKP